MLKARPIKSLSKGYHRFPRRGQNFYPHSHQHSTPPGSLSKEDRRRIPSPRPPPPSLSITAASTPMTFGPADFDNYNPHPTRAVTTSPSPMAPPSLPPHYLLPPLHHLPSSTATATRQGGQTHTHSRLPAAAANPNPLPSTLRGKGALRFRLQYSCHLPASPAIYYPLSSATSLLPPPPPLVEEAKPAPTPSSPQPPPIRREQQASCEENRFICSLNHVF